MSDIGPLDETERRRLKQLARRAVGRVSERIRMVLLSSRGYSIAQIAAIFECDEATVRHWLQRYQAEKESGLQDRPRSGRPRKADPAAQQLIRQTIEQPPAESGHPQRKDQSPTPRSIIHDAIINPDCTHSSRGETPHSTGLSKFNGTIGSYGV